MMRRPQNFGYEPVPQNQSDDLEIENERLAEDLKNKISNLKSLTIDIGECQRSHGSSKVHELFSNSRQRGEISRQTNKWFGRRHGPDWELHVQHNGPSDAADETLAGIYLLHAFIRVSSIRDLVRRPQVQMKYIFLKHC